ncbi:transporter substrate-binding domain-containing protein [Papillibacter cinnamivorans]|uniref:Amino acid ABC transporter substrate-binding protein, PAAT family n=1 Tax=Papillibacter cinnamivorans DSM 12816 TaxID=1122930 RepID=A0A1W2CV16_9FIRM|nr:transporter substrate-binding domain-containing protein [Papillibacter cinnamivorans]SMC89031.1 amino acid ABC transporter substrate-binding protein, PAAT family [Papillibacter cinnamivorans DSM 12816]
MKKKLSLLFAALFLLAAATGCSGGTSATPTPTATPAPTEETSELPAQLQAIVDRGVLRVGTKVDVPNFGYQDPKTGVVEGLEVDIAKLIAKKLLGDETKIETQGVTAQTRGPLLDNDEVDIIIATFTITDERKLSYNFTQPYYTDSIGFLVKKDSGYKEIKDLAGKTIGVAQSATTKAALEDKAKELGITFQYAEFASYPEINAALASGRVDAFSVDKSILLGYVNDSTEILEEGFKPQEYGIACKLSNTDLAAWLDEFVSEIKADGSLDALIEKWNLG